MKRKRNLYFDWNNLRLRRGHSKEARAAARQQKKQQSTEARQEKQHEKIAEREAKKQAKKEQARLFRQLQGDSKPKRKPRSRAPRWSPEDEEAWRSMLKSNPRVFPGNLSKAEVSALRKLAKLRPKSLRKANVGLSDVVSFLSSAKNLTGGGKHMAKKKSKKKRKNPRKGKMPAGLARWHREQKRKKNARKKKRNPRRRKPVPKVRRRVRRNPPRRRTPKVIKTNLRKGTKAFKAFVREQRAKYGSARVL